MTAKIDFYTNAMSRGRIAHWLMEELGETYETHWVEYGEPMKSAEYLRINPMGKVPALVYDGAIVTEGPAILTFLAATYPEKGLIPSTPGALADFYRWMFFGAGPVEQALMAKSMKWETTPESSMMLGYGSIQDTLNAVEAALGNGSWICGDQFTAVDVYIGSHLSWGIQFGTVEERPIFRKYADRCMQREAWQRANQINEKRIAETQQQPPEDSGGES